MSEKCRDTSVFVVKNELFRGKEVPSLYNRAFRPLPKDIRGHMYKEEVKRRFSKLDQVNIEQMVKEWEKDFPDNNIFFRSFRYKVNNGEFEEGSSIDGGDIEGNLIVKKLNTVNRLLFVHQTKSQKYLLKKYGNNICLLDATYKTSRYSVPLFFLVTKTNVDYQIVGSFAIQYETTTSITEALNVIKSWNESWSPKMFMVDNCSEEINAIENIF